MEVKTIAIIGAGTAGREIARAAALTGFRTVLEDVSSLVREHAIAWIRESLEEATAHGRVCPHQKDAALAQLSTARSIEEACRDADLIIEVAPEEMEIKLEIFTILNKFAKPGAIFASNASSLSIAEMAEITFCQEKCVGMRFVHSPTKINLLEIVRAPQTSDDTVETCREVGRRMEKEVIVIQESPAFLTKQGRTSP